MERMTFSIPPMTTRVRAVALLALSLGMQVFAIYSAPWFTAHSGGEAYVVELLRVRDMPDVTARPSGAGAIVLILMLLLGLGYLYRVAFLGVTIMLGRPMVKRGLFRAKLQVAWKTPLRAQIHTGILTALAIAAALMVPQLATMGAKIPGIELAHSWGGGLLVAAFALAHVALILIARDPFLAATQCWGEQVLPKAEVARAERPMIKSPLPPPPAAGGDPFRAPGSTAAPLENLVVRPSLASLQQAVKPTNDPNASEPSFLR